MTNKWAYSHSKHNSILPEPSVCQDLNDQEFIILYRFFVQHSPCNAQSRQSITFEERGWKGNIQNNGLCKKLDDAIKGQKGPFFIPRKYNGAGLEILFRKANLSDGPLKDTTTERAVTKSGNESNSWLRLFRHIRNCLAHGTFAILPRNEQGKVPVVMEDKDRTSYTARMVFSVETLLSWAKIIESGPKAG